MSTLSNTYCKCLLILCGFLNYPLKKEEFLNLNVVKFNTIFLFTVFSAIMCLPTSRWRRNCHISSEIFLVFSLIFSFTVHMGLSFYTVGSMGWLIWFHVQKPHELWFSFVNTTDWCSTIYWNRVFYLNYYSNSTLHYDIKKKITHTYRKKNPNSFMYQVSIFGFSFVPPAHLSVLTIFS